MILVDSNVIVSFLVDRDLDQQAQATTLFERAPHLELGIHSLTIAEVIYVMTQLYGVEAQRTREILRGLLSMPGLKVHDEMSWSSLMDLWPDRVRDFGDAVVASAAIDLKADALATFDQKFQRELSRLQIALHPF